MVITGIRQKQKQRTRKEILAAAKRLFADKGYEAATMREIAARAGISVGAIFVHFKDKVALLVATLIDVIDQELEKAMSSFPHEADIRRQLMHIPRHFYAYYARDPRLVRVWLKETLLLNPEAAEPVKRQYDDLLGFIANVLEKAKERGEVRQDTISIIAAAAYFSLYMVMLIEMVKAEHPEVQTTLTALEAMIDQLIKGIGTGATRSAAGIHSS